MEAETFGHLNIGPLDCMVYENVGKITKKNQMWHQNNYNK
jgi:hypothetical protein